MFWDNLVAECNRQGLRVTPLIKELGISSGNMSGWKKGGGVKSDVLLSIANRLGVTTDYLLTGKHIITGDVQSCINQNEEQLLSMYRDLPEQHKTACYSYIKGMHDAINLPSESGEKAAG